MTRTGSGDHQYCRSGTGGGGSTDERSRQGRGKSKPAGEQRSRIPPPKPPRLSKTEVQEKPPITARNPFLEELREKVINRYVHKDENKDIYRNVGAYEDVGEYEDIDEYEDDGAYEEVATFKPAK
ncbi:hypothetical protein [Endozoicomonas sp. YOMI1]|uniref:hypothetical protein n=1 Tax=Endozoicomonas sp. YOMI1 TaxID=2828739 RepID=UPI002147DBD7|nr:hypothetical protein [Endozoicomonas sp. YOMI1]